MGGGGVCVIMLIYSKANIKELRTKKTETDERSFVHREQLVCQFVCLHVPDFESFC